jgi:tetratricopeptide (TPR) repeat protein
MSADPRLSTLLDRWQQSQDRGCPLSAEELCRDCPELLPEVQRRIAILKGMARLANGAGETLAGKPNEEGPAPATAPSRPGDDPSPLTLPLAEEAARAPAVPGFEIEGELGRGGWGVVYRARQTHLNRTVALKMILAGGHAGAEERKRFLAEAKVIASIHHPGIVQIHEFGAHDGLPYFALEYCPGGSLSKKLGGAPLPPREAALVVEQVARAVQAAHDKGVIHRDLKPGNVLLDEGGAPRVTDFGLARRLEGAASLTQTGAVMGTPSYMSPEQARGKKAGPAADVYSLGAILYECLTGRPPFLAATTHETLLQVVDDEPASVRQVNAKVPRDLETVCMRCLHKEPGRRYPRPADLAEDLRRWLAGEPIAARPVRFAERAWKWLKRRPAVAGLLLLLALLSVGSLAAIVSLYRDAVEQARIAGKERDAARDAKERAEKAREATEERARMSGYAFLLAQSQREASAGNIAQALGLFDRRLPRGPGWEQGHLWLYIGEQARAVTGRRVAALQPESICFSRDGRLLAAGSQNKVIHLWEATTGRLLHTFRGGEKFVWSVALSPDGRWLASAASEQTIRPRGANEVYLWDTKTGARRRELKGHQGTVFGVRFAPDGSWLASAGADGKIQVHAVPSGEGLRVLEAPGPIECLAVHPGGALLAYGSRKQVFLCEARTGKVVRTLSGHQGAINGVAFSGDGRFLASADLSAGLIHMWDAATGKRLKSLGEAGGEAACVAFAPGKRPLLAFGHTSLGFRVVDLASAATIRSLPSDRFGGEGACFSPDGGSFAFSSTKGVGVASLDAKGETRWIDSSPESEWLGRFTAFDRLTASRIVRPADEVEVRLEKGPDGGGVRVVDRLSGLTLASFPSGLTVSGGTAALLAPDGSLRAEVEEVGVLLRDPRTGAIQHKLTRPQGPTALAFTRNGTRLAVAGQGGVKLWDPRTGVELFSWAVVGGAPRHLGFDDETNCLVLVGEKQVEIWTTAKPASVGAPSAWDLLHLVAAEKEQRWSDAQSCLARLLLAHPGNRSLRLRRARALIKLERFPEAVSELKRGTDLAPAAGARLTWWLAGKGGPARASDNESVDESIFEEVSKADKPDNEPLWRSPAQGGALLAAVSQALKADPRSWSLRALRGWLLVESGEVNRGAADLAAAARQKGSRAELWALLVLAELNQQRIDAADAARRELLRLAPRALPRWHREQAARREGGPLVLAWHLGALLSGLPRSAETGKLLVRRAEALAELARWKEAAADLGRALDVLPEDEALRCRHAEFLLAAGDLAGYRRACAALMRRRPASPDQGYRVARVCLLGPEALRDLGPVIRLAEWALRSPDPSSEREGAPPLLVAAALLRAGRFSAAVASLSHPDHRGNPAAQRLLLLAYRRQGRRGEAEKLQEQLLAPPGRKQQGRLHQQATALVARAGAPLGGVGVLGGLMVLESFRQKVQLGWADWREVLPGGKPADPGELRISTR